MTTLEEYIAHAGRYAVECVYEAAKGEWMAGLHARLSVLQDHLPAPVDITWMAPTDRDRLLDEHEQAFSIYRTTEFDNAKQEVVDRLFRLRVELDAIEAGRKGVRFTVGTRRRRSSTETAKAIFVLHDEGLITSEIAEKLGISAPHVQRVLKESRPPVLTPSFAGVSSVRNRKSDELVAGAV